MMTCSAITTASWKCSFRRENNSKKAALGLNLTLADQICAYCQTAGLLN